MKLLSLAAAVVLAPLLSACVVEPYGRGHEESRGRGYYTEPAPSYDHHWGHDHGNYDRGDYDRDEHGRGDEDGRDSYHCSPGQGRRGDC